METIIESFPVGPLGCNCTILGDPETKKALVVDPGGDEDLILARVEELGLEVVALLHTHAHLDHILATRAVHEKTGAKIHLHEGDLFLYDNMIQQAQRLRMMGMPIPEPGEPIPVDSYLKDGEALSAGDLEVGVLHTPGHTPGSCCFSLQTGPKLLVAGDTLFRGSIGRTDLPGGDFATIETSIRDRLYTLEEETEVITGHGPRTSIASERRSNPFVRPN